MFTIVYWWNYMMVAFYHEVTEVRECESMNFDSTPYEYSKLDHNIKLRASFMSRNLVWNSYSILSVVCKSNGTLLYKFILGSTENC